MNAEYLRECAQMLHAFESEHPPELPFDPIVAGLALADAYLAEHPADDDASALGVSLRAGG